MASGKDIKISITSALNAAGIEATKRQVDQMAKSVSSSMAGMASENKTHWADIKAAWDMAAGSIQKVCGLIKTAIGKAFEVESALANFKTLLGSVDAAKAHVADLRKLASQTPLTFGDLSRASKLLLSFGADVNDILPSLQTLGDISMGNAQKFQGLALVFAQVKAAGKLMGQDLLQMINQGFNPLTIIAEKTGASMSDLKEQMSEGKISFELVEAAMRSATGEGGRFNNAMKDASTTGNGLMSTLQDNWNMALASFGSAFVNLRKEGIQKLIDKLQELNQSGTVDSWAAKIGKAMESVAEKVKAAIGWIGKLVDVYHSVQDGAAALGSAAGAAIGTMWAGGSVGDAMSAARQHAGQTIVEREDARREQAEEDNKIKAAAAKAKADAEAAKKTETATRSLEEIYAQSKASSGNSKEREKERKEGLALWGDVYKEELADATKKEAKARRDAATASADVKTAEEKLKAAIDAYNDNIAQNLTYETIADSVKNAVANNNLSNVRGDLLKKVPEIGRMSGEIAADKAIKEGKVRTVADYDKFYNEGERAGMRTATTASAPLTADQIRAKRIEQMSAKARSKADKDWLEKYKKVDAGNKKQKEDIAKAQAEAAAAKQRQADAQQAAIDAAKDIDTIKLQLQNLGLK